MASRPPILLWLVVCAPACRGPDVAGEAGTATSGASEVTSTTTSGTTEPTGRVKLDLPPPDLPPPPPPLDCDMRPDVSPGKNCARDLLNWPAESLHWYELLYACTTGDKPDVCPAPDSAEVRGLLDECESCYITKFEDPVCGPDPLRDDACCYWALADIRGCPE